MHLKVDSPIDDGLLLVGVPFRPGVCPPRQRLSLLDGSGQELPIWWTPRALWPDGSRKWIWLHTRVPAGTMELELQATEQEPAAHESRIHIEGPELTFGDKDFSFAASPSTFSLEVGRDRIEVQDEPDVLEPEAACDFSSAYFQIIEDSPIAPLVRLCDPVEEGIRREYLFRIDPVLRSVHWTRRVSLMSGPRHELRSMGARLCLTQGQWYLPDFPSHHTLRVHRPHRMQLGHDPETDGHPDAVMAAAGEAVRLEKGWQRAPFALHAGDVDGMVEFYPAACAPLVVLQGTSFRHEVRLAVGSEAEATVRSEVRWSWDSEAAAGSGAFGPLIPRSEEVKRLFPGFDKAFEMAIDHCRPTRLDSPDGEEEGPPGDLADETTHDVEFFGLQHYGDWPMKSGAYGSSKRIYCDNEYDVPYALIAIAEFLRDVMWTPLVGAFIYELNAYNRGHRGLFPHYINLIVTRGLAYAHELTGDESFRKLTVDAAYGGLWTVFETTGGKEIGMVGRTSGATAAYMMDWWKRDQDALAAAQPSSSGVAFEFDGKPADLLAQDALSLAEGRPEYDPGEALICLDDSFAICEVREPWNTDSGCVGLDYAPNSTIKWDRGGNPHPGWGLLHLCDDKFTASAVTVMQFYDSLHVRFYDRDRKIIEVLEANVNGWQAGARRTIEFEWDPKEAVLRMDGEEVHRIRLPRCLSGFFRKLYLGCKPGNWKGKGKLYKVGIRVGRATMQEESG